MTKHKHLTLSDRNDIQSGLDRGETFKAIGLNLLKHPTTIAKEVKRNKQLRESTKDCLDCPLLRKLPMFVMGVQRGGSTVVTRRPSILLSKLKETMKNF
ncbi:IS30 family transposase [Streptococcus agalactiae]|nr:IS30 family transposase [Streptococcus agalactiae]